MTLYKPGRKQLTYEDAGPQLKRKLANKLAAVQGHSTPLLVHGASISNLYANANANVPNCPQNIGTWISNY